MNLGKLLSAGKSFFGANGMIAYRENKRVYLPKFNSEKNPFTPKAVEPAVAPESKMAAMIAAKTQKIATVPMPKPVRATNWAEKLNPFRAPQPVAPPIVNAVQPELSLDAVKVLHNDLSDADVEVVPVKSRSVAPVMTPTSSVPMEFLDEHILKTV